VYAAPACFGSLLFPALPCSVPVIFACSFLFFSQLFQLLRGFFQVLSFFTCFYRNLQGRTPGHRRELASIRVVILLVDERNPEDLARLRANAGANNSTSPAGRRCA